MKHDSGRRLRAIALAVAVLLAAARLEAAITVTLDADTASPAPVGTMVHWTATVSGGSADLWYRFRVQEPGGAFRMVRDFGPVDTLDWTALDEGVYLIEVTVRDRTNQDVQMATSPFRLSSRVSTEAAVFATGHPLVFLFSSPGCDDGRAAVLFGPAGGPTRSTPFQPCVPGRSLNFYLAGLLGNTSYTASLVVQNGRDVTVGSPTAFATGDPSFGVSLSVLQSAATAEPEGILLQAALFVPAFATDLNGNLLWFAPGNITITRPDAGGTFWGLVGSNTDPAKSLIHKFDLVGMTVQETNAARVNEQLVAMGKRPITGFHHDVRTIGDGRIVTLGGVEQILTGAQGPVPVDILGDEIVVLDSDLQVVWAWDAFDHLDVHRKAILGEQCKTSPGCAPFYLDSNPNDWTHSNAVSETPDGALLLSVRHQDWILKIDYDSGQGDGGILWRLGNDGDFTIDSADPLPWFSHQHDVGYEPGSRTRISLFDNGNTRAANDPKAVSRGQVLEIDEVNKTANLALNAPLGFFSLALGTAQRLSDGNYHFDAGFVFDAKSPFGGIAYSLEISPADALVSSIQVAASPVYRSFRLVDLYGTAEPPARPGTRVLAFR